MTRKRWVGLIVLGGICCLFLAGLLGMLFMEGTAKKRVAILYIATGRYLMMWDEFYQSAEQNFLPGYEKHYYIWTDDQEKKFASNVTKIERERKGFPGDTIDRFEMFLGQEEELKTFDYLYFFNANAQVVAPVGEEILPNEEQGITVTVHPGYWREVKRDNLTYPYERRPSSTAYIPEGQGTWYVQGGFNGGRSEAFLHMAKVLNAHIKEDQAKGVTAIWHDESHLNKYILDKHPLVLPPNYIWANFDIRIAPEIKNNLKIIMRDKGRFGGTDYVRGYTNKKAGEVEQILHLNYPADKEVLIRKEKKTYCLKNKPDECGTVTSESDTITVTWDTRAPETFFYLKKDQEYHFVPEKAYRIKHPFWSDYLIPDTKKTDRFCRMNVPKECGFIEHGEHQTLKVRWDRYKPETFFLKGKKRIWALLPKEAFLVQHPFWTDYLIPNEHTNKFCRGSLPDECGRVEKPSEDELIIRWEYYAPETFIKKGEKEYILLSPEDS